MPFVNSLSQSDTNLISFHLKNVKYSAHDEALEENTWLNEQSFTLHFFSF